MSRMPAWTDTAIATTATAAATSPNTATICAAQLVEVKDTYVHRRLLGLAFLHYRKFFRRRNPNPTHRTTTTSNLPVRNIFDRPHLPGDNMTPIPWHIRWLDHQEPQNDNVWWSKDDLDEIDGPAVVDTVGYIVRDEQGWLAVVGQLTEDGMCSQPLVLIKSCILSKRELTDKPPTDR